MDSTKPVCCGPDNVKIMEANYKQIDLVFGEECPMCGVNLKKLWCRYTCDPHKSDYVEGLNYVTKDIGGGQFQNFTAVKFTVDEDSACNLFRSCRQVSLIAQASL